MKNLNTTITIINADGPFFGAYVEGSMKENEPLVLLNINAICDFVKEEELAENKLLLMKDTILQTIGHEIIHVLQEWLDKKMDEYEVEKVLGAYNEKWNVFEAEGATDNEKPYFIIEDFLKFIDNIQIPEEQITALQPGIEFMKSKINNVFAAQILWQEAEKKHQEQKLINESHDQ